MTWDSLGRYGRSFVAGGPSVTEIGQVAGGTAQTPIRAYAGLDSAGGCRGPGPPGRRRPRTGRRVLALRAGGRDHHRLRVDRPGVAGHAGVPDRRRHRDRHDAVLLPAVVAVVPGGPGPRPRRRPGAVRRRLRPLVGPARRTPARACSSAGRASARSARRPRSAGSSTCATGRPARCSPARRTSTTLYREFVDDRDAGSTEVAPVFRGGRTVRFVTDPGEPVPPAGEPVDRLARALHAAPVGPGGVVEHRPDPASGRTGWRSRAGATSSTRCAGSRS